MTLWGPTTQAVFPAMSHLFDLIWFDLIFSCSFLFFSGLYLPRLSESPLNSVPLCHAGSYSLRNEFLLHPWGTEGIKLQDTTHHPSFYQGALATGAPQKQWCLHLCKDGFLSSILIPPCFLRSGNKEELKSSCIYASIALFV